MSLASLIANAEITVEELAAAQDLIDRADLVVKGLEACRKTLVFPLGVDEIQCYSDEDHAGERYSWGMCTHDGLFTCWSNWGGDHEIGRCNLTKFEEVFMAFEKKEFAGDLRRFLLQQVEKAK